MKEDGRVKSLLIIGRLMALRESLIIVVYLLLLSLVGYGIGRFLFYFFH